MTPASRKNATQRVSDARSPIAQMASVLARPAFPAYRRHTHEEARPLSRSERIRELLRERGPLDSHDICENVDFDLEPKTVSALLKADLLTGRVLRRDGRYEWNAEYSAKLGRQLSEAVKLLRRHGYLVQKQRQP